MSDKGMTTMEVKRINKNKVYSFIRQEVTTSKHQIVQKLQMGLSTVSQNLKILEEEGLIEKNGCFESTGGRKAQAIQIRRTARISIGIGILKKMVHFVAIDLYGAVTFDSTQDIPYQPSRNYYRQLGQELENFIIENGLNRSSILGVSIATQGIIAPDGQSVSYGVIMDNIQMKLSDFTEFITYPCRLEHDSKAAAYLELWNHNDVDSALVLLLNRNLGGSVITNGQVHQGIHMHSGIVEHLCITPDGPLCYCGCRGCLETYCSANALENTSGMDITSFFLKLRNDDSRCRQIWDNYLNHLAFAIRNLNIIIDGSIIISGYLAPFFTEEDAVYLVNRVNSSSPFTIYREQIILGTQGQYTPAIGAALYYISEFLQNV
ncbi:ROK family protein [uncultured Robinsoniella sp.]|uniref:ROK family transcriptional regulator n=1 Tax=uncultured Robinsoniella sp. TaxID=904190 RepID=UPI00374FC9B9